MAARGRRSDKSSIVRDDIVGIIWKYGRKTHFKCKQMIPYLLSPHLSGEVDGSGGMAPITAFGIPYSGLIPLQNTNSNASSGKEFVKFSISLTLWLKFFCKIPMFCALQWPGP
jgi:hypothetical protein